MDDYPEHLAPNLDDVGFKEPFETWWPRVREHFIRIPENVAKYWLYEHWNYSPYRYLPSDSYNFSLVQWPTERLRKIRSAWSNFEEDQNECWSHGRYLVEDHHKRWGSESTAYMLEHGDFPAPIIVLDNRDGHLSESDDIPTAHILIEGHKRFNRALYLHSGGQLNQTVSVWLMERDQTLRSI